MANHKPTSHYPTVNDDYFNTQKLKDSIPRHDSYYSPIKTPFKTPTKFSSKSILKESLNSVSKGKKNIQINEALNETRKIPLKHELSDFYSEKRPRIRSPHEKNTIGQRPNATIGGPLEGRYGKRSRNSSVISLEQRNIEKKHYQNNTLFEPKKEYKPNQEKAASFDTNVNMVDISREGFSEYQKAYVRKMQRERELEIYSQILSKSSSDQNREDYMSKSNPEFYIESRKDNLRNNFKNPKEGKTSAPSPNPDETWRLENFPNLDHIEDKIYELEQNLDNYSRKLRASIERQQDHLLINRNVKRGYEALENSNKFYKKKKCYKPSAYELMRDENNRNISSQSHLKYAEIAKGNDIEKTMDLGNTKKSSVVRQYRSPHANKEMKQELEILRKENEKLNKKLHREKDHQESMNSQFQKQGIKDVLDKEKELLKIIDQMKNKLLKSIIRDSEREQKATREQSQKACSQNKERIDKLVKPKKFYEEMKPKDVNSERAHMTRVAYGSKKLERENASNLYQGLSTSYNGFYWNADQNLKLSKNIY